VQLSATATPPSASSGAWRPGVSPEQATAALTSFARAATQDRDDSERAQGVELRSKAAMLQLTSHLALLPLLVAIGLTMAIPCANVTNMVLARGLAGQREIGIRLSLGASRGRVVLQLLTEGLVMACGDGRNDAPGSPRHAQDADAGSLARLARVFLPDDAGGGDDVRIQPCSCGASHAR